MRDTRPEGGWNGVSHLGQWWTCSLLMHWIFLTHFFLPAAQYNGLLFVFVASLTAGCSYQMRIWLVRNKHRLAKGFWEGIFSF